MMMRRRCVRAWISSGVIVALFPCAGFGSQAGTSSTTQPASGAAATASAPAGEAFLALDFNAACAQAKKESKVVFIDFFTTWCLPCKQLDATTWRDPVAVNWLREKTVPFKVDCDKNKELAQRFSVNKYPTLMLIRPDGTVIDRYSGYLTAPAFVEQFSASLNGRDSVARTAEQLANGNQNKPQLRLQHGDALAQQGKHKEALEEFLWCYDRGVEFDKAFLMIRNAGLVNRIMKLKAAYPPAVEALKQRRDAAEQATLSEAGLPANAMDAAVLNRALGEVDRSVQLFDKLRGKGAAALPRARALLTYVFEKLLEAKRYADIAEDADALTAQFKTAIASVEATVQRLAAATDAKSKNSARVIRREVINQGGQLYEALLGAGKTDAAEAVSSMMIKFAPSGDAYATLIGRAVRAGQAAAARKWAEAGKQAVGPDEQAAIDKAAAAIPADGP